jgi:hypothetical protein
MTAQRTYAGHAERGLGRALGATLIATGLTLAVWQAEQAHAAISVGASGSGVSTFDDAPDAGDWSTLSLAGGAQPTAAPARLTRG